jgi:hypothetical protein
MRNSSFRGPTSCGCKMPSCLFKANKQCAKLDRLVASVFINDDADEGGFMNLIYNGVSEGWITAFPQVNFGCRG